MSSSAASAAPPEAALSGPREPASTSAPLASAGLDSPIDGEAPLLSPELQSRLARLSMIARRLPEARRRGRRRIRRLGRGTDAIDTRGYAPGDDPRLIAWPAYARFERLLVRVMADEAPLRLALLIDTSASMGFGSPSKLRQAARIAAGLAAVAVGAEDRIAAVACSSEARALLRASGGQKGMARLLHGLDGLRPSGDTDLRAASEAITAAAGGRALCVILSDMLDPRGAMGGAKALRSRGHDVALIEILTPFEEDPPALDGYELEDEESGELLELPPSGAAEAYREALAAHRAAMDAQARALDIPILRVSTEEVFDSIVGKALQVGMIRAGARA
ncbi:MAG: DUF58 domain-containing protein [Myxococcales bacterium]|nr:DUF58 domain-containing protein [Myxococcales bacterium]